MPVKPLGISAWNDVHSSDGKSETNFGQDGSDRISIRTTSAHYYTRHYRVMKLLRSFDLVLLEDFGLDSLRSNDRK
ncbi:hypothetical protein PRIPAC_95507, partial [Pristionchus pacificus]|uniref:Uncharacterized protein n=1 Tax=Pristionchus pacificus TaxID=54126 RepID=A0A2A6B3C3_PRIPA